MTCARSLLSTTLLIAFAYTYTTTNTIAGSVEGAKGKPEARVADQSYWNGLGATMASYCCCSCPPAAVDGN
jgi:hypothetical protein